jgi:hypothetical protein
MAKHWNNKSSNIVLMDFSDRTAGDRVEIVVRRSFFEKQKSRDEERK